MYCLPHRYPGKNTHAATASEMPKSFKKSSPSFLCRIDERKPRDTSKDTKAVKVFYENFPKRYPQVGLFLDCVLKDAGIKKTLYLF